MEALAAGYTLANSDNDADYTLRLAVTNNMVVYDDGFEEQAPPDEPQFILSLTLFRNEDNYEMVSFSFPFSELEEMYDHNLALLYQAMANVPLTKLGDVVEETDRWRNKWLYLRGSLDFPITVHALSGVDTVYRVTGSETDFSSYQKLHHQVAYNAGLTLGLELQFLNWMSAELDFIARFGDPLGNAFVPGLGLQIKFPIKPSRHYMLEPYVMAEAQMNTSSSYIPPLSVGGGMQLGVKGGETGAFFVDANFLYTLGKIITESPYADTDFRDPNEIPWQRWIISIGIGYKIGFIDRPVR